jgi:hypothetical protein
MFRYQGTEQELFQLARLDRTDQELFRKAYGRALDAEQDDSHVDGYPFEIIALTRFLEPVWTTTLSHGRPHWEQHPSLYRLCLPRQAARAQEAFRTAKLHWFDKYGHFPMWD